MLKCDHAQAKIIDWLKKLKKESVFEPIFKLELEDLRKEESNILKTLSQSLSNRNNILKRLVLYASGKKCSHHNASKQNLEFEIDVTYCITCCKLFDCRLCLKSHISSFERHSFFLYLQKRAVASNTDISSPYEWSYSCSLCNLSESINLSERFKISTKILFELCNPKLFSDSSSSKEKIICDTNFSEGPAGLINMGNTCFFNSSLQSLAALKFLREFPNYDEMEPFVSACLDTLKSINNSSKPFKPLKVFSLLSAKYKSYKALRQEDAHEALARILDILDCQTKKSSKLVEKLFTGKLLSVVECLNCHYKSLTLQPFCTLSLNINSGKGGISVKKSFERLSISDGLTTALKRFFAKEELPDSVGYKCEECNKGGKSKTPITCPVLKYYKMAKLPSILILHMQRFEQTLSGKSGFRRLSGSITFEETIELSDNESFLDIGKSDKPVSESLENEEWRKSMRNSYEYQLSSVVCHLGSSLASGHYIAYSRRSTGWYYASDSSIMGPMTFEMMEKKASPDVYILMYEKK